jgi:hypothetical protein
MDKKICQRCCLLKTGVEHCRVEAQTPFEIDYCEDCRGIVARRWPVFVIGEGSGAAVEALPPQEPEPETSAETPPPADKPKRARRQSRRKKATA